jgi:hypothetical protein
MAWLISNATGNMSASTTWGAAETGSGAVAVVPYQAVNFSGNTTGNSPTFTINNGDVIDGVVLFIQNFNTSPAGAFTVALQKSGVTQASVTVNCADLAAYPNTWTNGWIPAVFFKFTSTATGDGTANWRISCTSSSSATSLIFQQQSSTAYDYARIVRTTTAAAPAAGNDLMVTGALTGQGTNSSVTVTMDSTSTTTYGSGSVWSTSTAFSGIHIGAYGTLTYGIAASTNYYLKINGDLKVWANGTLNIGVAGGNEVPRTSTAVLEFVPNSASTDFGLSVHNYATFNAAGLSRTSGQNVVKCKLTANITNSQYIAGWQSAQNITVTGSGAVDAGGTSVLAYSLVDNASASVVHFQSMYTNGSIGASVTQTLSVFLARGSGTNNRYVRLEVGDNTSYGSIANGYYVDVDLQAGTLSNGTGIGTGSYTSSTITACGTGYVVRLTGVLATSSKIPTVYLISCSGLGTVTYTGNTTQCFIFDRVALVTASSISDTSFSVDTNTGWLSGDVVCMASTSKTVADCTTFVLNGNATASSFTSPEYSGGLNYNEWSNSGYSGTAPTQGEIGLINRNVKIRSNSSSLYSYVYIEGQASATMSWVEFYYLGSNSIFKYGITIHDIYSGLGNATAKSITYCSIHDGYQGLVCYMGTAQSINVTFSNNVVWNTSNIGVYINGLVSNADWTFSSNLVMHTGQHGFQLADVSGVCSNNTVAGASGIYGFFLTASGNVNVIGTFFGNVAHSNSSVGLELNTYDPVGIIDTFTAWRNNGAGIACGTTYTCTDLTWNNLTLFGNGGAAGQNFILQNVDFFRMTGTNVIAGDASFSTAYGIYISGYQLLGLDVSNLDMSGTGTGLAPHTTKDLEFPGAGNTRFTPQGSWNNSKFGTSPIYTTIAVMSPNAYIGFEKYNQTSGDHRTLMLYGWLQTDSTIYNVASPSMRMTPNSASNKLQSAPRYKGLLVPVLSGNTVAISVYVRTSVAGDGAAYNGNPPRLIQRANPSLGQNSDVVLATFSGSAGTWTQLTATTSVATDNGCWEFIIDCDGTTGWVNVDDWSGQ